MIAKAPDVREVTRQACRAASGPGRHAPAQDGRARPRLGPRQDGGQGQQRPTRALRRRQGRRLRGRPDAALPAAAQARVPPLRRQDRVRRRESQGSRPLRRGRGGRSHRPGPGRAHQGARPLTREDSRRGRRRARPDREGARRQRVRAGEDRGKGRSRRSARGAGVGSVIEGLQSFQNVFKIPELKRRVLFSAGMLVAYRIGAHVPTPGIDGHALAQFFDQAQGTLLGMVDLFSGGNLRRLSIFALGIMPYISASIILQLLTVVIPALERLAKEGEAGRKKITQYTRYGTIVLSAVQAMGIAYGLESMRSPSGVSIVPTPGWAFRLLTVVTLTAGTALIMWMGEQISEKGIGNGISLIILAGIVVRLPSAVMASYTLISTGELRLFVFLVIVLLMVAVTASVVLMQEGQRKIPVQYAKRVVGRRVYGGQSTHIPLPINTAGGIPGLFPPPPIPFPGPPAHLLAPPLVKAHPRPLSPGPVPLTLLY